LRTCHRDEALEIPISLGEFKSPAVVQTAVLATDAGALIGFASIPADTEPEASLMVHPDFRRRGIGRALIQAIRDECIRRGLQSCLLVTDHAAISGKAFLAALDIPYSHSEFRLELDRAAIDRSRPRHDTLVMRPAIPGDAPTLIRILAAAFDDPEEVASAHVMPTFAERTRRFYLAEREGEPIGALRAGEWDGNGDITAFGVLPEHQGKGYGRQMLLDAVDLLTSQNLDRIYIEVAVENRGALGLYESAGFRVRREYGYYTLHATQ
jgi:ribosomal protein S18 acetylase RimI-like enzyme